MSGDPKGPGDFEGSGDFEGPDDFEGTGADFDFDAEFAREFGPKVALRCVLVVPVANATKLAEVCTIVKVSAHVVPVSGVGCVLVSADPATGEHDVEALSLALRGAEIVLLSVGEDAIDAQSWVAGVRGPDPRPGLLLSVWPDLVQQLVLGRVDPEQAAAAALGGEGSRIGAFWKLFRGKGQENVPDERPETPDDVP
ncbi:MAG: hypothetical protein ACRYF3_02815 [Janthinobacterium lividum]